MPNNKCSICGKEAEEGDKFIIFVDPKTEWWKELVDPMYQYCEKCVKEIKFA